MYFVKKQFWQSCLEMYIFHIEKRYSFFQGELYEEMSDLYMVKDKKRHIRSSWSRNGR